MFKVGDRVTPDMQSNSRSSHEDQWNESVEGSIGTVVEIDYWVERRPRMKIQWHRGRGPWFGDTYWYPTEHTYRFKLLLNGVQAMINALD